MRCLYAVFFVSGATALIYQVLWVRLLTIVLGTTVAAVSTVLTVFMLGLALGAGWSARWADLRTRPLARYAALELGIAGWGLLTAMGHHEALRLMAGLTSGFAVQGTADLLIRPLVAGIWLLPPTWLMGATLPVAATSLPTERAQRERRLSGLYTCNTLGAVFGGLACALLLVPALGVTGSLFLTAGLNVLLALGGWWLDRSQTRSGALRLPNPSHSHDSATAKKEPNATKTDAAPVARPAPAVKAAAKPGPARVKSSETAIRPIPSWNAVCAPIAFLSGFLTLAVEVLWTRFFGALLTSNVLVIAVMISGYLFGLGCGSLLVTVLSVRVRSLPRVLMTALLSSSVCVTLVTLGQPQIGAFFQTLHRSGLDAGWSGPAVSARCLLGLFVLAWIPAIAFGTVMPLTLCACVRSAWTIGRDVGRVLAANTIGAILGAALAGFVLLPQFGLTQSLLLCCAAYALAAVWLARTRRQRLIVAACAGVLTAGPFLLSEQVSHVWFNGGFTGVTVVPRREVLFHRQGAQGSVAVIQKQEVTSLLVDGTVVAETTRADLWDLLLKAHLPMLLHEHPRRVALVGLGAGISLGAVQAHPDVERIDCIELCEDVIDALPYFATSNAHCWKDPRTRVIVDDGRHFLLRTSERYDVISVDPVDPPICTQYSQDFLAVCRDRLAPGGYMVQWLPLFHLQDRHIRVVIKAFLGVFPDATLWYDGTSVLLVARRDRPVRVELDHFLRRASAGGVLENLRLIDSPHPLSLLSTYVCGPQQLVGFVDETVPANTDDRPYLEYTLLHAGPLSRAALIENLELFVSFEAPLTEWVEWDEQDEQAAEAAETLRDMRKFLAALHHARLFHLREDFRAYDAALDAVREEFGVSDQQLTVYEPFLQ